MPRRASHDPYDEVLDEKRGTNILLTADSDFTNVQMNGTLGPDIKTHGFSSVKLLPLPSEVVSLQPELSTAIYVSLHDGARK